MKLMYINGAFTKGYANEEIEVTNPATEDVLETVPRGTAEDVEAAVRAGKEAFTIWRTGSIRPLSDWSAWFPLSAGCNVKWNGPSSS